MNDGVVMYRVLLCDDDDTILSGIKLHFEDQMDFEVTTVSDRSEAIKIIQSNEFDVVVSDLMFPDEEDGLAVIKCAKSQWYTPAILAITAFDTVENAVRTMQAGADDFASKGFGLDEIYIRIKNVINKKRELIQLTIENKILKQTVKQHFSDYQIIGVSPVINKLLQSIKKISEDSFVTCLIQGESGTGKDLVARSIHSLSQRSSAPFMPINCAAIPSNLLESELFGHEKGSFTGAYTNRQGKFEQAEGGVIFLDEIGELPLSLQVNLLRVLEEREIYRIGGKRPIKVNVMILAASNTSLEKLVEQGKFREDLYFRLNVINIWIPPLRDRRSDVVPLAKFFLQNLNQQRNKNLLFSQKALNLMKNYDYRGNVRELRNIIEDAFVFCDGTIIRPENLYFKNYNHFKKENDKPGVYKNRAILDLQHHEAMQKFETDYFLNLLGNQRWNINETAKKAGISREWLSKKVKHLGLKDG
jgi:two-component system response regulator AtoC